MSARDMPADYDAQLYQDTIDAIRAILGKKPLYKKEKFSAVQRWGAELYEAGSVSYNRTKFSKITKHTHDGF